jgi:hypothetical protein
MGLHVQGSALPPYQVARGNPWAAFVQSRGLRPRSSRQQMREQSSVATLRPAGSRANIRESAQSPQAMRPQTSRINLRAQPSRRQLNNQLNNQASTRTLRASENGRPPPSPTHSSHSGTQPVARPARIPQDDMDTRVRELIETRRRALGQHDAAPTATNPFTRRAPNPANVHAPPSVQHTRTNSNESMQSANSSGTVSAPPTSPGLSRRRSNRSMMYGPPPGVLPPPQGAFTSPVASYNSAYSHQRQGSMTGSPNAYERGMNPMTAGPLI